MPRKFYCQVKCHGRKVSPVATVTCEQKRVVTLRNGFRTPRVSSFNLAVTAELHYRTAGEEHSIQLLGSFKDHKKYPSDFWEKDDGPFAEDPAIATQDKPAEPDNEISRRVTWSRRFTHWMCGLAELCQSIFCCDFGLPPVNLKYGGSTFAGNSQGSSAAAGARCRRHHDREENGP